MSEPEPPAPDEPDPELEPDPSAAILDPWDRLEETGETEKGYAAFLAYRALPPAGRSARRVVPIVYGVAEGHPDFKGLLGQLQKWSSRNLWIERCAAWDRQQADELAAAHQQALLAMRDRHASIATTAITRALNALREMNGPFELRDLIRLLDLGLRTERLARGDTERVVTHQGPAGGPIQVRGGQKSELEADNLRAVVKILVEAGAMPPGTEEAVGEYLADRGPDPPAD